MESEVNSNQSTKVESVEKVTVAAGVLAELLGVTDRRIRQLAEEGILLRTSKGRYLLAESVKNYIKTLKITTDIKNGDEVEDDIPDLEIERGLHERVKRKQSELKLALMKGELHKSNDVQSVMSDMLSNFKSKLLNLPSKISPMLVGKENVGEIKDVLTNEMHTALKELKEYNPKDFQSDDYIEFDDDMGVYNEQ